jgi:protein TonB
MATLRVPFAAGSGVLLSLSIFWLLWMFVDVPMDAGNVATPIRIEFTRQRIDTPIDIKRDERITRELPPPVLQPPRIGPGDRGIVRPTPYEPPKFSAGELPRGRTIPGPDRDALALVRVQPDYPARALRSGIEGWVQVQFSITTTGAVKDPIVVGADPENMFETAALNAIARWRYQPKVEDGVAVERVGVQTVIRFALDEQ